ncbi:hypothetical protein QQ045_023533 [Rhodiola kirilowii]
MKTLSFCYSHRAVKVSDSSCNSRRRPLISRLLKSSSQTQSSVQNSVSCVYKSELSSSDKKLLITLTWTNDVVRRGFDVEFVDGRSTRDSDVRKSKGYTLFDFNGAKIELFWNLSEAEYDNGCEPCRKFYLVIAVDAELCLKLGDTFDSDETVTEIEKSLKIAKTVYFTRRERFSGNTFYATSAKFCEDGAHHEIVIKCVKENDGSGAESPLLLVLVDGRKLVRVGNLMWNFRGSQTIFLDGLVVDVMWDVQEWLFDLGLGSRSGPSRAAVFLFRTRTGTDSRVWYEEKNLFGEHLEFSLVICGGKKFQD